MSERRLAAIEATLAATGVKLDCVIDDVQQITKRLDALATLRDEMRGMIEATIAIAESRMTAGISAVSAQLREHSESDNRAFNGVNEALNAIKLSGELKQAAEKARKQVFKPWMKLACWIAAAIGGLIFMVAQVWICYKLGMNN